MQSSNGDAKKTSWRDCLELAAGKR